MPFIDPAFEARRQAIAGGTPAPKPTGARGASFSDPSFEARRQQYFSTPSTPAPIASPPPQPVATTQTKTSIFESGKQVLDNLLSKVGLIKNEDEATAKLRQENLFEYTNQQVVPLIQERIKQIDTQLQSEQVKDKKIVPDVIPFLPEEKLARKIVKWATGNETIADQLESEKIHLESLVNGQVPSLALQRQQVERGELTQDQFNNILATQRIEVLRNKPFQDISKSVGTGAVSTVTNTASYITRLAEEQTKNKSIEEIIREPSNPLTKIPFGLATLIFQTAIPIETRQKIKDQIGEGSKQYNKNLKEWVEITRPVDQNLATQIAEGVGSTVPFMFVGEVIGGGAQLLGMVSPTLASWFAAGSAGALEAMTEAGGVYQENIDSGMSQEEAANRADKNFWGNVVYNILLDKVGVFNEQTQSQVRRFLTSGAAEGVQEAGQQIMSNLATDKPFDEGVLESGGIGAVIGSMFGIAMPSMDSPAEPTTTTGSNIDPKDEEKQSEESLVSRVSLVASNSLENNSSSQKDRSVERAAQDIQDGKEIKPVEIRKTEEGEIVIVDGRHRLEAARSAGVEIPIVDVTTQFSKNYSGDLVAELKGEGTTAFDYDSTQLNLPTEVAKEVTDFSQSIAEEDLYTQDGARSYGREENPHITVLYGLNEQNEDAVRQEVEGFGEIEVELGEVSVFENEDYDVVKVDVISKKLDELNQKLDDALDAVGNTFDEYKPHVTIAYVKKGQGQKYAGSQDFKGKNITLNDLTFSSKSGETVTIPLTGSKTKQSKPKKKKVSETAATSKNKKKIAQPTKGVNIKQFQKEWDEALMADNFSTMNNIEKELKANGYEINGGKVTKIQHTKEVTKNSEKSDETLADQKARAKKATRDAIYSGETQEESAENVASYFKSVVKVPDTKAEAQVLKAIRAEAKKLMFEVTGATTGNWKKDYAFFMSAKNAPEITDYVTAIEDGIADIDEAIGKSEFTTTSVPSGFADVGGYADIQSTEQRLKNVKSVQLPELIRIARELTGFIPDIKRFRSKGNGLVTLGKFYPMANGIIKLHPDIFKDPVLTAKVLAHEMGHMTDYFDDLTMARGNLIGRIASLKQFMRSTFTDLKTEAKITELTHKSKTLTEERRATEQGSKENKKLLAEIKKVNAQINVLRKNTTIKQSELYEELKNLTQKWKPFDEESVPPAYIKYRYSAPELYADAISVLFNDPDLLKAEAPIFYKSFFEHIDRKPKVAENFYAIWDLLNKGEEEILDQRAKDVRGMFEKGEDKVQAMMKERQTREDDYVFKLKYELIDKNQAIIDKVQKLKKQGKAVSDEANPEYWLEEYNYVGGIVKNWVAKYIDPIYKELQENDLTWEDFGEVLFHERVINERGAVSNVFAYMRENAIDTYNMIKDELPSKIEEQTVTAQLAFLKEKYGKVVDESGRSLYDEVVSILPQGIANPLGFDVESSKKQLEHLKAQLGKRWAVIEKLLPKYRRGIQEVLKEAEKEGFYKADLIKKMQANPAYAAFQVVEYMDLNIPASIKQQVGTLKEIANPATSTVVKTISMIRAIERNKVKKQIVEFLKEYYPNEIIDARTMFNGKSQVPIEPKDDKMSLFTTVENGQLVGYYVDPYIASTMEFNGTGNANAVISILRFFNSKLFRPLFITFNLGFQSFNLMRDFIRFYKNVPNVTLWGALYRYIEALPAARRRAFGIHDELIAEMEEAKILGITYNDTVKGFTDSDKQIDAVLDKAGLNALQGKKPPMLIRPFAAVLDFIEKSGNMIETVPKVAGYKELNGKLPPKELGHFIRTSVGSPDFMRKGAGYRWYNEVFLFSNAIKEGIRSDFDVAIRNPRTRSGYWFKTAQVTLLPKMIMFAALAGLLGDELKKMFENISDYDLTNYTIIPMGKDESGRTIYLRIPQDETGRLIGGILWKSLRIASNKEMTVGDVADLASYTGGQVPSLSPIFQSIFAITQFAAGQNPYDFFRGRNVIPDQEFTAGGKYALKPYIIWQINQLGGGTFMKMYYSTQPAETKGWIQKVVEAPIASNTIGRWLKVSDYGQAERNQKIVQEVEQQSAKERIETNNKINKAIVEYRQGSLTEERKEQLEEQLLTDILGDPPYYDEVKTQATNIGKKFRLGILKGESDESVNALIYANSNKEKKALLTEMRKDMNTEEFDQFVGRLIDEKVISYDLAEELEE